MSEKQKYYTLHVSGMTCSNCALGISRSLEKDGYRGVMVDFAGGEVQLQASDRQGAEKAVRRIEALGYRASLRKEPESSDYQDEANDPGSSGEKPHKKKSPLLPIEKKFWFTAIFTLPLIAAMFIPVPLLHNDLFQLALTIPVFVVGFLHFGRSALGSLRAGVANMDVLIFMGSTAAFVYSLIGTIGGLGHAYMFYETSASIISIVLLGNMLEQRSVRRTTSAIDELVRLQKNTALLIHEEMHEGAEVIEEVDAARVKKGQAVLVNTGDKVPVDGRIYWGHGSVDESMISGESIPVDKKSGDEVVGGTILLDGTIRVRATAVGHESMLSQIIEMVRRARADKPRLQNLADRISMVFVPVVVGLALLTIAFWFWGTDLPFRDALMRGIAVLVIACPCALGLAIPTAVVTGLGRAAKSGILLRGGTSVDKFTSIETMVFDKTGTLTTGSFRISRLETLGHDENQVRALLYSLEKHSGHPIAKAITRQFKGSGEIRFREIEERKGVGITATDFDGNHYVAGSYLVASHITPDDSHNLYLLMNDKLIAWANLEDEIKPGAKEVIESLKAKGIHMVMLSGDRRARCREVADALGIDEVYAECLPSRKLEIISDLSSGRRVAMVGDGINDAPALSAAWIGISMSDATQVAVSSAEVVLLKGKLDLLAKAFAMARTTQRTIKENLFWAFFYNVAAIPLAMAGFLTPIVAAAAMAASDIVVVLNSIRLKRRRLR